MHEIKVVHILEGPFDSPDPIGELLLALRANGYGVDVTERDEGADASDSPLRRALLRRGEEGAGWWSSDMSKLATTLTIDSLEDAIRFEYRVVVRGQRLNDEERGYWTREATSVGHFLTGEGELGDWRQAEAERARRALGGRLRVGLYLAVALFVVLFILQLLIVYR